MYLSLYSFSFHTLLHSHKKYVSCSDIVLYNVVLRCNVVLQIFKKHNGTHVTLGKKKEEQQRSQRAVDLTLFMDGHHHGSVFRVDVEEGGGTD